MSETLDEWIEKSGFEKLVNDFVTHFEKYGGQDKEYANYLARLCMTSLRQELQDRVFNPGEIFAISRPEFVGTPPPRRDLEMIPLKQEPREWVISEGMVIDGPDTDGSETVTVVEVLE